MGGCSLTKQTTTTPKNENPEATAIGTVISNFASDASSGNERKICNSVISTALKQALNRHGGCDSDVTDQIETINNFGLTITKYSVTGDSAIALVKSPYSGKTRVMTVHLVKQAKGGWRLSGIS